MREIKIARERFALAQVFTISRGSRTHAEVISLSISEDGVVGRGECVPYARYRESMDSVEAAIESVNGAVSEGASRADIQALLPAGAARNAVDCALWDLEAKLSKTPVWKLAGLAEPKEVVSAYTLSLDTPDAMARMAEQHAFRPLLKLKLTGDGDLERVAAVRAGAPDSQIIVDANEGWSPAHVSDFTPHLAEQGVSMIEQPLPANADAPLAGLDHPVPFCADESCHDTETLSGLVGRYEMINIKLDKTGGLTEALLLKAEAQRLGFSVMVGCMVVTSLAMAPALLVAQDVEIVDVDGPLLLAEDRKPPLTFEQSTVFPASPTLWG